MNLKQIKVGDDTVWVRPLSYREHREMAALPDAQKSDYLIEHIIVDDTGSNLPTTSLESLGMDVIHAAVDYYLSIGRSAKN